MAYNKNPKRINVLWNIIKRLNREEKIVPQELRDEFNYLKRGCKPMPKEPKRVNVLRAQVRKMRQCGIEVPQEIIDELKKLRSVKTIKVYKTSEKERARYRNYYERNKEKVRLYSREYKARKRDEKRRSSEAQGSDGYNQGATPRTRSSTGQS